MKTTLPKEIKSVRKAEMFLTDLFNNNEGYHPEDDAHDIVWNLPESEIPTSKECDQLNKLMEDIYNLDGFDPCEFILDNFKAEEAINEAL